MKLSAVKNGVQRAGRHPVFYKGMDTVNADAANSMFAGGGHSYVASSDRILLDLYLQTRYGFKAEKRNPPLGAKQDVDGFPHFSFKIPNGMKSLSSQ